MMEERTPETEELEITGHAPEVWIAATFAPEWFADAVREAQSTGQADRRREIVFAVCTAESYLFEWVRDSALNRNFKALSRYFPPGKRVGITKRWRKMVEQLAKDGRISARQDFNGTVWQEFTKLVAYRNGLVHGGSSRPWTSGQPSDLDPVPSTDLLEQLDPGWAVGVVEALVKDLHRACGTTPPSWLQKRERKEVK